MKAIAPLLIALLAGALATTASAVPSENLPELGDAASAIVSPEMEREIGQQLLREVRAQVPTLDDPILDYYTDTSLARLAEHSDLKGTRLYPVLIDSPEVNAFAAPGGVVGINAGLYLTAQDVNEYSAVLAHELSHLAQRHFARGIEMQQQMTVPYIAAMLASIALAAAGGGQAGIAAISATQAAAQAHVLSFSREREQEADRTGIQTLYEAGLDPTAMAKMFDQMDRQYRFSQKIPEFLLDHPVTETRISDAREQASKYPARTYPDDPDFQLMKARVTVHYAPTPADAVQQFKDAIDRSGGADWAYYGLAVALKRAGNPQSALDTLKPLEPREEGSLLFAATKAEMMIASKEYRDAHGLLSSLLAINPDNKPLSLLDAEALTGAGKPREAEAVLRRLSVGNADDINVWYQLAETSGLAGNVVGVHLARAEYFALLGNFEKAIQHLQYARKLTDPSDFRATAMIDQRVIDFRKEMEKIRKS